MRFEISKKKINKWRRDRRGRKREGQVELLGIKMTVFPKWEEIANFVKQAIETEKVNRGDLKDVMCIARQSIRSVCEHGSKRHIRSLENSLKSAKRRRTKSKRKTQ